MDTPVTTKLICLPLLPNAQAISIEVNSNTTVDRLKQKIKTECTPLLDGVGAPELLLYAPKNQDADQKTISQILANPNRYLQNLLNVFQTVAECFPTIPAGKIHILVRLPSATPALLTVPQVTPRLKPPIVYRSNEEVNKSIDHFLKELRPKIKSFLTTAPTYWIPESVDATTRQFYIDLAIPVIHHEPSLLIHNLGNTRNPYADNLARGAEHKILYNTSGSGKTRILFDLLCQHWGFYFVMGHGPDRIGAVEFERVFDAMALPPNWNPDIFENRQPEAVLQAMRVNQGIASRLTSKILLARWIIFRAFIEVSKELNNGALDEHTKLKWLLFQVCPPEYAHYWDPFIALIESCLFGVTDRHLSALTEGLAPDDVLGPAFNPESDEFFYVLDEAQLAGKQYTGAFANSSGNRKRPLLSPILHNLLQMCGPQGKLVVSGTEFSLEQFETRLASGICRDKDIWKTVHETGDFTDQGSQLAYISRYFPPSFFLSPSGQALKPRLYERLRGRYRFTVTFIEVLLTECWEGNHPVAPHRLFNAYVYAYTDYMPADGDEALLSQEPDVRSIRLGKFDWKRIEKEKGLLEELARLSFMYNTQGIYPTWSYENQGPVGYGIARFKENKIWVDEPLALTGIIQYFDSKGITLDGNVQQPSTLSN